MMCDKCGAVILADGRCCCGPDSTFSLSASLAADYERRRRDDAAWLQRREDERRIDDDYGLMFIAPKPPPIF